MKILLFLCVGASLVHLGVQNYSYLTIRAPRHWPMQNSNDFVCISIALNFASLDQTFAELDKSTSTIHPDDGVAVFLSDDRSPTNNNASVTIINFKNSTYAKTALNNFVSNHSSHKISHFFISFLNTTDAVVISYADKWKVPVSEGSKYRVTLEGTYNVMINKELGFTMVEIPRNQYMAMLFILPEVGKEKAVESAVNKTNLEFWRKSLTPQQVNLEVPRATLYVCEALTIEIFNKYGFETIRKKYAATVSATFP